MKTILRKGKIEILIPEKTGGGLTGETHMVTYDSQKYVLRKCKTLSKAKYYEHLSNKFEKYGFLPKFLGRIGKNVFYEYIGGRDLRRNEKLENIKEVGKIISILNRFEFKDSFSYPLEIYLNELVTGKYRNLGKVALAREMRGIRHNPKKLLSKEDKKNILEKIAQLRKDIDLKIIYECTDPTPGNFRIRDGKIYLVDIDSIKAGYKGIGISKFFLQWGKTKGKKDKFIEGYGKKNIKFLDSKYRSFVDLNFLVRRLWFEVQTGKNYKKSLEKINNLIKD
jgi:hypothetical protein|tara:strand:- start:718 stop:1557 length:840 start_codon:yes stop_codon:yes gene_type:complete